MFFFVACMYRLIFSGYWSVVFVFYLLWYTHGGCPAHKKGAPAKDLADGDPAVRVCDLDSRSRAFR